MGRALKYLAFLIGGIVALMIVAAVSFMLLFDPNDFRDRIAAETKKATGRDLQIEGDLSVSLFPWLAISMGKTSLGNAPGFGDEPFASFDEANLSVRLLPLLLSREVSVGTAALDSLHLNLEVAADGSTNWDDLAAAGEAPAEPADAEAGSPLALDIASIEVTDTSLTFTDNAAGATYLLTEVNLTSGRVAPGDPVPLTGGLHFETRPDGLVGQLDIDTTVTFDPDAATVSFDDLAVAASVDGLAETPVTLQFGTESLVADTEREVVTMGELELSVLDIDLSAQVEPFSYVDLQPDAAIQVEAFSPRSLMQRLNLEVPETADPQVLTKLILDANASVGTTAIALTAVTMTLDDTTFSGSLSVPMDPSGIYEVDLAADRIELARYMAPAGETAATAEEVPVEIPADLLRSFNVRGSLALDEATLGDMLFTDVDLGLRVMNGNLRLHPISAAMFGGSYTGDVRIDASAGTPVLSVDEKITDVQLGALVAAMFGQQNVTGTISGKFVLRGRGDELADIQQSLSGNMSFDLADGALEGTDIWYELRRARALLKQEPAPELDLPARTEFSNIRASGPVSDGVFRNDDFLAELPFMRLTGKGTVDFAAATMDYRLSARVFEKPELVQDASAEELQEFTSAVIPVRITGLLSAPSVKPDVEALVKQRVKKELEERVLDKLLGGDEKPAAGTVDETAAGTTEGTAEGAEDSAEAEEETSVEDKLKEELLKNIFER